jgi:hypothetical protein
MVRILEGYRSCLTIVRIHPTPYITFHKAAFLGMRSPSESEFIKRLTNCMFFNTLVSDRGPPWRQCDVFDDLYSVFGEQSQVELADPSRCQCYKTTFFLSSSIGVAAKYVFVNVFDSFKHFGAKALIVVTCNKMGSMFASLLMCVGVLNVIILSGIVPNAIILSLVVPIFAAKATSKPLE